MAQTESPRRRRRRAPRRRSRRRRKRRRRRRRRIRAPRRRSESARTDESLRASSFSVPVLAIDASVMGHSLLKLFFLNEWRGCPTLSSSPAVGRGASFALAPDRRVGSVLHRRPPVPPTRGRGTFTAGSRHERAEEENGTGNECTSAAGGWRVVDRMRRRVRAPARDKCGFDGCIRVH